MAGRGREATMPAWMTAGSAAPAAPGAPAAGQPPPGMPAPGAAAPGATPMFRTAPGGGAPPPAAAGAPRPPFPFPPGMAPPPGFPGAPPTSFPGLPPPGFFPPPGYPPHLLPPPGALPPGMLPPPGMMPPPGFVPPPGFPGAPAHAAPAAQPQAAGATAAAPAAGQAHPGQAQPAPAAAAATAAAQAAAADGKPKPDWTEHTAPDGRKYYYNAKTKTSSWEKPDDLMNEEEKKAAVSGAWKEYTAADGRKYYYNRITKESKWTLPDELKKPEDKKAVQEVPLTANGAAAAAAAAGDKPQQQTQPAAAAAVAGVSNNGPGSPAPGPASGRDVSVEPSITQSSQKTYDFSNKAEAKEAFKDLLSSVNCASDWTWEQAMRLIAGDYRYSALKSLGEKKQCFNEYLQQRRNEEREEERRKAKQAKDEFVKLILDNPSLKSTHTFRRAKDMLEDDPRWKAVPERERQELFDEAQIEKRKKEKEEEKLKKKKRMGAYRDLLERTSGIKVTSEWRKVWPKLEGEPEYEALDKLERLEGFQEFIKELERKEREEKEREREEIRRQERKHRDMFKELLLRHKDLGLITVKTRWKEYSATIKTTDTYAAVERNAEGSRPKQLFEDLIEDMEAEYDRAKIVLKEVCKDIELPITSVTVYDEWRSVLEEKAGDKVIKVEEGFRRTWFDEQQGKARDREEEEEARRRRARDKLSSFLRHCRVTVSTVWEEFLEENGKERELRDLDKDVARQIFEEYQAKLRDKAAAKAAAGGDKSGSDEEGERKQKKDKKRKSSKKYDRDSDDEDRKSKKKHKSKDKDRDADRDVVMGSAPAGGNAADHAHEPEEGEASPHRHA